VAGDNDRWTAISAVLMPVPAARSTSVSLGVSGLLPVSSAAATSSGSITRSPRAMRRISSAGASGVEPVVLRLPPGTREWYLQWLGEAHPHLVERYEELYGPAGLPSPDYERRITGQISQLCQRYGMRSGPPEPEPREPRFPQLALV
jgi:hypothetical protein